MTDGAPWFEQYIAPLVAAQIATRESHLAISAHWRVVSEQTARIADRHEALAATLPDAVQTSADLATMATAHHQANVSTVLRGEQQLNQERDAQIDALGRRLSGIEAKIDQLLTVMSCADCPLRQAT